MKLIIEKNSERASQVAADLLFGKMLSNRRVNLSITAGATPICTYKILTEKIKDRSYLDHVHYYNFDEIPLRGKDQEDGITMSMLRKLFFDPANISEKQIEKLTGANYQEQDERIQKAGGLDLIFMGIGADGHFCGNLPKLAHFDEWTVKKTAEDCVKIQPNFLDMMLAETINAGFSPEQSGDYYVTMGTKSVLQAKELLMMATGKAKANIVKQAFWGKVTEDIPSSVLRLHPNFILLLDEEAACALNDEERNILY
ncbi:6-phosphogluconolactonase [Clostridia bacterium]|nr:6-phosphogluconolactonase [Clostridia bacterium]